MDKGSTLIAGVIAIETKFSQANQDTPLVNERIEQICVTRHVVYLHGEAVSVARERKREGRVIRIRIN